MTVYTSPYSTIDVDSDQHLLSGTWFKKSVELNEEEVKKEISKIPKCVVQFSIKKILMDVRNYPFRENETIQFWIAYKYMSQIMDLGVERYAIIVEEMIISELENFLDPDEVLKVEYFTDADKAKAWLKSK